jgi:DNA ligase (NAD+)
MSDATPPSQPVKKPIGDMSVDELAVAVRYHNWRYFSLAEPALSDDAFDRLTERLRTLAPDHPALAELVTDAGAGEKVVHSAPMLSLDKCYDEVTLDRWAQSFEGRVIETPKIDGVAASIHYDTHGRMVAAVTRGDGRVGESFTANARHIEDIPNQLSGPPLDGAVEVRGEIYMRRSVFATLADQFSNPRNTTAGAIKQKDARKTAGYRLSFFVYDVLGRDFDSEFEKVAWSSAHGLVPVDTRQLETSEMQPGYEAWLARRDDVDYEMDGVVYKVDLVSEHRRLGATAHHPRWAIAYKFQGDSATTILREVEWSVSRTGTITPVAIIEPVELSGARVSRCTLHNLSRVRELALTLGATVVAMRRGGVIPHIEAVKVQGDSPVDVPGACPSCGEPTAVRRNEQLKGGEVLRVIEFLDCTAPLTCPAAVRGTFEHFTRTVDIEGFGPKMVDKLLESRRLQSLADLYRLTPGSFQGLEGVGEILAAKLVQNVQDHARLPLPVFLAALGVEGLGAVTSEKLSQHYTSLGAILALDAEELAALDGFQETLAQTIIEGLRASGPLIEDLGGVVTVLDHVEAAVEVEAAAIAGRSFVFTGTMATLDRKSAQKAVRERGGSTPSSVTRELGYLVVGDKGSPLLGEGMPSSKQKTAERYAGAGALIAIITESAFVAMLEGGPAPGADKAPDDGATQGELF